LGIGDDDGNFTWGGLPVPIGCYSILLARLKGEQLGANPAFLRTRAELKERAQADAVWLVQLGLVDALLGNKDLAISEAKHAVEMLPISKDALEDHKSRSTWAWFTHGPTSSTLPFKH
jgi:hypothetical protein